MYSVERQRIADLESENAELRAALEFYADAKNYTAQPDAHGHKRTPIMVYKWTTARAALVKARGKEGDT